MGGAHLPPPPCLSNIPRANPCSNVYSEGVIVGLASESDDAYVAKFDDFHDRPVVHKNGAIIAKHELLLPGSPSPVVEAPPMVAVTTASGTTAPRTKGSVAPGCGWSATRTTRCPAPVRPSAYVRTRVRKAEARQQRPTHVSP